MGNTGRPDESSGMGCTSLRDPSASFLFLDIFFGTGDTFCDIYLSKHVTLIYSLSHLHSSFPFSFPRSFLSFLVFLRRPSSPIDTSDIGLCAKDEPEGPAAGAEVSAAGGTEGTELELGVGNSSPSDTVWYCNKDFNKNLDNKKSNPIYHTALEICLKKLSTKYMFTYLRSSFALRNFSSVWAISSQSAAFSWGMESSTVRLHAKKLTFLITYICFSAVSEKKSI